MSDMYKLMFDSLLKGLLQGLANIWPFYLFLFVILFISATLNFINANKIKTAGFDEIDLMTGEQFEVYLQNLFIKLGYKVTKTNGLEDMGCDLVIEKDGTKTAVQAKRWKYPVRTEAVQEVVTAKNIYGCTKALVVTNNVFTWRTKRLAEGNGVELWDRYKLAEIINKQLLL